LGRDFIAETWVNSSRKVIMINLGAGFAVYECQGNH